MSFGIAQLISGTFSMHTAMKRELKKVKKISSDPEFHHHLLVNAAHEIKGKVHQHPAVIGGLVGDLSQIDRLINNSMQAQPAQMSPFEEPSLTLTGIVCSNCWASCILKDFLTEGDVEL